MDIHMADIDCLYMRLFGRAPIYDLILSCLEPGELVRVALTCRAVYLAVAEFKTRAYNINRHFSRYFSNPVAFRSLQARTNSLVSGSNALQFFDRSFYHESDLDLYTHPGHSFEVARFLVELEGYTFVYDEDEDEELSWTDAIPSTWDGTARRMVFVAGRQGPYPLKGLNAVYTFKKTSGQDTLKIQVIEAASSPVELILDFHSTCVMNVISSEAAYALYPFATFINRSALAMKSAKDSPLAITKYVRRGWRIYFLPTPDDLALSTGAPFMFDKARTVGDRYTWVLPLDQTGVQARKPLSVASAPLKVDPVRCYGWTLQLATYSPADGYKCHWNHLQSTIFRYNYAISDVATWVALREWANEQGRFSYRGLSKEDWVWFDADIPGFLRM